MIPDPASRLGQMMAASFRPGRVTWIGLRPGRREPMASVEAVDLIESRGAAGDRYSRRGGSRQVTLIQAEDLAAISSCLGRDISPMDLRRNIVTAGVNLLALKGRRFRLGDAVLEHSGECHPCSRMEETFGPGGYNVVRGRGGITARVILSGRVHVGDAVRDL
ncbi:MAG: MOSC domain-containing protein [Phenylobacterium zucineum]|nr:MAG: MOSC domain-containing protein [Phenylobacterium zucineum]